MQTINYKSYEKVKIVEILQMSIFVPLQYQIKQQYG